MKSISKHILLLLLSFFVSGTVCAAGGVVKSPTGTAPDRYVYYPGTEELVKDEIRLIACGTGLPAARRDQAAVGHPVQEPEPVDVGLGELDPLSGGYLVEADADG